LHGLKSSLDRVFVQQDEQLLARRIAVCLRVRSGPLWSTNVQHLFGRVFDPDMRITDLWNRPRTPFAYIMMFSQHTPRDLLYSMREITACALALGKDPERFSAEAIKEGVRKACHAAVKRVAGEYSLRLPHALEIMEAFTDATALLEYPDAVHRILQLEPETLGSLDPARIIDTLYEMGFFGRLVEDQPSPGRQPTPQKVFEVHYSYTRAEPNFCKTDTLLIHPMFWGRFNIKPPLTGLPPTAKAVD